MSDSVVRFVLGASKALFFNPFRRTAMEKAPSTFTAMVILAVFLCSLSTQVWASSQVICIGDVSCSGAWQECSTPNGNCTSHAFTAQNTGTYTMRAMVKCQTNCHHCEACVIVTKSPSDAVVGHCSTNCLGEDCDEECTVELEANGTYYLWVCLMPCLGQNCNECAGCKALGCICYGTTSCNP